VGDFEVAIGGRGYVVKQEGMGDDARLTIEFPFFGQKKLLAGYVRWIDR